MIIGFDVDGVLCNIEVTTLYFTHHLSDENAVIADGHYYRERKPLLNPEMFLAEGDSFIVLTSRPEKFRSLTEKFLNKFCPNYTELIMCGDGGWTPESGIEWTDWNHESRVRKAKKIIESDCDVYIDDSPSNVAFYREYLPLHIKVIQYGGRLGQ